MAKTPHRFSAQTRPSGQGLSPLQVSINPNQFGAGLGHSLANFADAMEVSQHRDEQTQRFDTLTNFADFETNVKLQLEELKRNTQLDTGNFYEQAESIYEMAQADFLNNVPAELQPEFESRAAQIKQGVVFDVYDFNYKQQDLFFTNKITEHLTQAELDLAREPQSLEPRRGMIYDLIDSSGLTPIEKERQKKLADVALESITYQAEMKDARSRELRMPTSGLAARDLPPEAGGILSAIASRESGGRYDVKYGGESVGSYVDHPRTYRTITEGQHQGGRSSAAGKYQFIASTWDRAAAGAGVSDFSPESQDHAAWYWAQKTYADVKGGSLSTALAQGDFASVKEALGTQWEGVRQMSLDDFIDAFEGGGGEFLDYETINRDPRFANVSLDTRDALRKDAYAQAQGEYNDEVAQRKAREDQQINDLYVGLYDGTKGQTQIDTARQAGWLRDYDNIAKAQRILEDRIGAQDDYNYAVGKLEAGGLWLQDDTKDKNGANALYRKSGGKKALEGQDSAYVQQTLIPQYEHMQMAAPDMVNSLAAMSRSQNAGQAAFAFETMRQMREHVPEAFAAQFDEDTQKKLDFWSARRNYYGQEELVAKIQNRGLDQAQIQRNSVLRTEAQELAKENATIDQALKQWDTFLPFDAKPGQENFRGAPLMEKEFKALYTDAYVLSGGDADYALQAAQDQISRVWNVTRLGGSTKIMRYPPEVAGYRKHRDSYDWIEKVTRQDLAAANIPDFGEDTQFEFIADETTETEIARRGAQASDDQFAGELTRPSYLVWYKDKDGVPRLAGDENGVPYRVDFVVDKETLMQEEAEFRRKQRLANEQRIVQRFRQADANQINRGEPIPPEVQREYDQLLVDKEAQENTDLNDSAREALRRQQQNLDDLLGPRGPGGFE